MPRRRLPIPTYRRTPSGRACIDVYRADGKRTVVNLPGAFGSAESIEAYQRHVALIAANAGKLPGPDRNAGLDASIAELAERYVAEHVETHFVQDGSPTSEQTCIRAALKPLLRMFGPIAAREFDAAALEALRNAMISGSWTTPQERERLNRRGAPLGWSRNTVNGAIARVRQAFRWGVLRKIVPVSVVEELRCLPALRAGRSAARERPPVEAVDRDVFEKTLPFLAPIVADLLRVQSLTGARSGELCQMRSGDVDRSSDVWVFRPAKHKTSHKGKSRAIPLGPRAKLVLARHIGDDPEAHVFSPRKQELLLAEARRRARKTPLRASQEDRRKPDRARPPGEKFTPVAIARAVARACRRAGVPHWHPHMVRHLVARETERQFGVEAARALLGHARVDMTAHYSGRDLQHASEVASQVG